jgi:hypothetical protein
MGWETVPARDIVSYWLRCGCLGHHRARQQRFNGVETAIRHMDGGKPLGWMPHGRWLLRRLAL